MIQILPKKHQILPTTTWGIRSSLHSLIAILVATLLIGAVYLTQDGGLQLLYQDCTIITTLETRAAGAEDPKLSISSSKSRSSSCNLFSGKWVSDNQSYPLYKERQCTYMSDQLACEKFGRKDLSYQNWRWQPHQCDLPRFNATKLLERLRNKRLVFVGDSLNRGQWVSMVCLVESAINPDLKSMPNKANGSLLIFKATEYNATIEFYWAPLLVESNSDDPVNHRVPDRIVRAQAIEKHARHWTDADVLVFNSYLWWRRSQMNVLWGSFESQDGIYKDVELLRVYEMALKTCSKEWGETSRENCYKETEPITEEGYWGNGSDPKMMRLVENVLDGLRVRGLDVQILNITQLSEYRKEGHPSIYRKQWEPLTEEQVSNPSSFADCIHWCLPGVPDVWNELLYAYIFQQ
ncbi:unnamed protein product [Prunus armeniaca]|uniref:Uncharacterized protein n=1 Tax=Prunus armeniaca TaxID=36596 RepID=A0A6J5VG21_PRUAR|nr:unnamed protein product [Prunus armeniaca]